MQLYMEAFKKCKVLCECWLRRPEFLVWPHRVLRKAKSGSDALSFMTSLESRGEGRPRGLSGKT